MRAEHPTHFGAGPAVLPTEVLQQAAADLLDYKNHSIGVAEISHRSSDATAIIDKTKENLKSILEIPDTHEVIFLQGGGTTGFSVIVMNLMAWFAKKNGKKGKPGYMITGNWSQKAYEEAIRLGYEAQIVCKNEKGHFVDVPESSKWAKLDPKETPFVYYCDNETVNGVEFQKIPEEVTANGEIELVADMSSNFISRKFDVSKFGLIFAGAQKNVGIAGLSVYIIKKSLLDQADPKTLLSLGLPVTPIAYDFPLVVKNNSAYNTIPIFTLQILNLVLDRVVKKGLQQQQNENEKKAELLYGVLDKYPEIYNLPVDKKYRSKMNVVFTMKRGDDQQFLKGAEEKGLTGLKGHRSVGGMRASLYNAVDYESVVLLAKYVEQFAES